MSRTRFRLTSEQLELLLAFEKGNGLARLASLMAKDQSVVSRNLQRLAEAAPVLVKSAGRWCITPLGRQVCAKASAFACELDSLLDASGAGPAPGSPFDNAALVVINAQRGLLDPILGGRSTPHAESNIERVLKAFRLAGKRVFHVRHVSRDATSVFHTQAPGVELISGLGPIHGERVFDKETPSALENADLEGELEGSGVDTVVLVGFTANECIDATARHASGAGFRAFVVGDATASFELRSPDGQLHPAERVHRLTLANLHAFVASVVETSDLLKDLQEATRPLRQSRSPSVN